MKNKKLIYFLIPMVLFIWGGIIYKIIHQKDNLYTESIDPYMNKSKDKNVVMDTISIDGNYRDPFLDSYHDPLSDEKNIELKENIQIDLNITKPKEIIPDVKYFGLILNQKNKLKLGLFQLNKKNYLLHEGDTLREMKISKLYVDSVNFIFHKVGVNIKKCK